MEATAAASRLDDDALILFTSGSTGEPKGVVHTHRSLRARWISLREALGTAAFARTLCVLPTHFGHGLICNCLFPWLSGQDLILTPPFRADILVRLGAIVDEHRITFLSSVPAVWKLALKLGRPPRAGSLQRVHCGSAPLSASTWEDIRRWTGVRQVCNAYGITETGSWVAGLRDADCAAEDGLIGEGWGAVIKVLHTRDTSRCPRRRRRVRAGRVRLRVAQHAGADEGLFPARRSHRGRRGRRVVRDRRHRRARRAGPAGAARPRARRDQQGRHEDLPGRHGCRGGTLRARPRRVHVRCRRRDVRPGGGHGGRPGPRRTTPRCARCTSG